MYAITAGETRINGQRVETFEREVVKDRAQLNVIAGTTGYKGRNHRDAGCRVYVGLDCVCGDFNFSPVTDGRGRMTGVEIAGCGDDSLTALVRALKFAVRVLDEQRLEFGD